MGNVCSTQSSADSGATQQPPLSSSASPTPAPAPAPAQPQASEIQPQPSASNTQRSHTPTPTNNMASAVKARIAIVYYSMYGHIGKLAKGIAKGVEAGGAEPKLFQIPETLSEEVLGLMKAPPKDATIPTLKGPAELNEYDGIIFGIPTRFGMAAAQVKAFMDMTGGIWQSGGWVGKTAGIFFSTATQGGGQETTALTFLTQITHHGMVYVPGGYINPALASMDEMHAGSPYGAGTFAGPDGSRQPSAIELSLAESQGKHHAEITNALKAGRAALAANKQ